METLKIKKENKFRSLHTMQAYKKGEVICVIPANKIVDKPSRFTLQISKHKHVCVGKLSALNHSCNPNVVLDTENMLMIANSNIEKGEELSYFYPSTEWEMNAPFICLCGSANCIHVVKGARFLPHSILMNYYFNKHIREMITELL
jgi:hypothetical protein